MTGDLRKLGAAGTLAHAWANMKAHRGMAALGVAALVVAALVPFWPFKVAVLSFAQYHLKYESLADDGLLGDSGRRRLLAVIGIQLLVSLIVLLGLTLLVLPGLYFALRLLLAVPALLAEDAGVLEAVAISWRRTAGQEWALLRIWAMAIVPAALLWTAFGLCTGHDLGVVPIAATAIAALLVSAVTFVFGWFVAAAAYAEGGARMAWLEEVFA